MLICALDYPGSGNDLTCTIDGKNMEALARASGITDVTVAVNEQCTVANVRHMVQTVAARCQPYDTFIFNYSGHGTSVTDTDNDEDDGQDEAFVFVDEQGNINVDTALMTDDEFSALILKVLPPTVTVICIADCCHSGSIMDFVRPEWKGRKAISISGCRDTQTSGDTGNGGICTHSLLLAIESLTQKGLKQYSVGKLFNETINQDNTVFASPQDITLDKTRSTNQNDINWPLIPKTTYKAPYQKKATAPSSTYTTTGPAPSSTYTTTGQAPSSTYTTTGQATTTAAPTTQVISPSFSSYVLPNPGGSASASAPAFTPSSLVLPPGTQAIPTAHGTQAMPATSYVMPAGSQVMQGTSYVMPSVGLIHGGQYMMQSTPAPAQSYVVQASGYPVMQQGKPAFSYVHSSANTPTIMCGTGAVNAGRLQATQAVPTSNAGIAPYQYLSASPVYSPRGAKES